MTKQEEIHDKMMGCLYGQAIGDALGLGTEFMNKVEIERFYPNKLKKYDQIVQDSHRRRWDIGAWTDDTEMMLCLLNALDKTTQACTLTLYDSRCKLKS